MGYAYAYQKDSRELVIGHARDIQTRIGHEEIIHDVSEQDLAQLVKTFQAQEMIVTNISNIPLEPSIEDK